MNPRFSAVMFDCDGVLVDSEAITIRVLRQMLADLGWELSEKEALERFSGKSFVDEWRVIREHTGTRVDDKWIHRFRKRRNAALKAELRPISGARKAVDEIAKALPGRIACVSIADVKKIKLQLKLGGFGQVFGENIFSGLDLPRNKPEPDIYLAAAAALGVDPRKAAVIEDSVTGVLSGADSGATVFGFAPSGRSHGTPSELLEAGAHHIFTDMADLPALVLEKTSK